MVKQNRVAFFNADALINAKNSILAFITLFDKNARTC